jgi:hypothetical protein
MHWHVSRGGKIRGPFSGPEVFELIGKRQVERGDLVDADQQNNWWPIEQVPTFAASFPGAIVQHVPVFHPPPTAPTFVPDSVCRGCGAQGRKVQRSRMTSSSTVWFVVLLVLCLPVAFLVLFLGRERYTLCQACGSHG